MWRRCMSSPSRLCEVHLNETRLHNEVRAFTRWASPTPVEDETRGLVVQHISQAITDAFPDANVLPFGSYGTKLYLPSG